jgi:small subunit ribosomal protein S6
MRTYEMMVVIDPSPDMEKIDQAVARIEEMITGKNGKILLTDRWGRRRLAYEIQHRQYGYYTLFMFEIDPKEITDMNRSLRLNSMVLRHLILVMEPKMVELALSKPRKSQDEVEEKPKKERDVTEPDDSESEETPPPSEDTEQPEESEPVPEVESSIEEPPPVVEEEPPTEEAPETTESPLEDETEVKRQESEDNPETDSEEDKE